MWGYIVPLTYSNWNLHVSFLFVVVIEPTNELDAESVLWLQTFLETYSGTVVSVTHDRYFMQSTQWILELDRGKGTPYEGTYSTYLEKKSRRLAEEEKVESSRRKLINEELEWIRSTPKGRQAKSKARVSRYNELLDQDKSESGKKERKLDSIYIPPGKPLGDIVVEVEDAKKVFGDRILFEGMNFSLPPGGIVGVTGANGTGMNCTDDLCLRTKILCCNRRANLGCRFFSSSFFFCAL